jgi:hypothetical protein
MAWENKLGATQTQTSMRSMRPRSDIVPSGELWDSDLVGLGWRFVPSRRHPTLPLVRFLQVPLRQVLEEVGTSVTIRFF